MIMRRMGTPSSIVSSICAGSFFYDAKSALWIGPAKVRRRAEVVDGGEGVCRARANCESITLARNESAAAATANPRNEARKGMESLE